nr:putative F-box protein At1g32420 [Tanacetum cinerariifolium]
MVILWNPFIRKSVGIPVPYVYGSPYGYTLVGFGVCPDANDPKLVKINVIKTPSISWEVQMGLFIDVVLTKAKEKPSGLGLCCCHNPKWSSGIGGTEGTGSSSPSVEKR